VNHLPSPVKYREDINGLRAWAVMAVLLFHFTLIGLPGGFAGVDIFFVISGYLMTAIIVNGHEKDTFSIWKFYMSRIRRIVPVLLVLITVLLMVGWFYLPTLDYKALGSQSIYAIAFLSNIHFWLSSGYFDSASHEKFLLHTWSLAVEAQFYILYPIYLALVWKLWKSLKAVSIAIVILFVASLIINLYASSRMPDASFYLLPTRGWELASGGLVFLAIKNNLFSDSLKNIGYWLGWILIIGSFSFIFKDLAWPSYWALFPVLGASLIMLANKDKDLPRIITQSNWAEKGMKINDVNFKSLVLNSNKIRKSTIFKLDNKHIFYVSPIDKLCNGTSNCVAILDANKTPLAFDYGHLTKEGSLYVTEKVLAPVLEEILKKDTH